MNVKIFWMLRFFNQAFTFAKFTSRQPFRGRAMFKGVKNGRFERIRGLLKCRLKETVVRKKVFFEFSHFKIWGFLECLRENSIKMLLHFFQRKKLSQNNFTTTKNEKNKPPSFSFGLFKEFHELFFVRCFLKRLFFDAKIHF